MEKEIIKNIEPGIKFKFELHSRYHKPNVCIVLLHTKQYSWWMDITTSAIHGANHACKVTICL
jgi:hypothetical protein